MSTKVRSLSKRHFQNNFILYFILAIFFVIGIVTGAIIINRLNPEQNLRISSHFSWIFNYIKEKQYRSIDIFKSSLFSNAKIVFLIWVLGLTSLGILIIPLIICWKGAAIGFTVGFLVKEFGMRGFIFSLSGLLPHYLIIIPGFLSIGAIGLSSAINNRKGRRSRIHHGGLADYSILILLCFIIVVVGCFIEGFFTPYFLNFTRLDLL